MTTCRSIDAAANGYIRHRFVRALASSFVVAATFAILVLVAGASVHSVVQGGVSAAIGAPIGIPIVLAIFILPIIIAVAIAGGLVDVMPRRLVGFALFIAGLLALLFSILTVVYAGGTLAGFDMTTPTNPQPLPTDEALAFAGFGIVALLITYELMREGWWQFTVRAHSFNAVRGWRPSIWRLFTSFRRYLGLPGFLSYVGKKRRLVSLLYFGVAVLNLGLLMALVLPVELVSPTKNPDPSYPLILFGAMATLLLLNLLGAGSILARIADKRATALYQRVREWDARPPIVFLRAFDQDKNKLRARSGDFFARMPAGVGRSRTLDEVLLEHGSPYGPVIAIGDPRDPTPPLGAARVFVPGEGTGWQDVVRGLAAASKAVVMCPNRGEGVQWELDLITQAQGRLRAIFLASPDLDRDANLALFQRLVPSMPDIKLKQSPIAAYQDAGGWHVLTVRRFGVESFTAALNTALQAQFGMQGVPLAKQR